jgi:hypothetical protein
MLSVCFVMQDFIQRKHFPSLQRTPPEPRRHPLLCRRHTPSRNWCPLLETRHGGHPQLLRTFCDSYFFPQTSATSQKSSALVRPLSTKFIIFSCAQTFSQYRLMIVTSVKSCHKHAGLLVLLLQVPMTAARCADPTSSEAQCLQAPLTRCNPRRRSFHDPKRPHATAAAARATSSHVSNCCPHWGTCAALTHPQC